MSSKQEIMQIITSNMQNLQSSYAGFADLKDYQIFTLACIKEYLFAVNDLPFDAEQSLEYLVDGSNDGGIDAILNMQNDSGDNDLIIVQCKHYKQTKLSKDSIISDLVKIKKTIHDLDNGNIANYNQKLKNIFKNAREDMSDGGKIIIHYFTSYVPTVRQISNLECTFQDNVDDYDGDIHFGHNIASQIDENVSGKLQIESDHLTIDENNFLKYQDSLVVNVSAKSLQDLYIRRGRQVLGLNLRYHIASRSKSNNVDNAMKNTIAEHPADFWYMNNGIVIACDEYSIRGNKLTLKNFSIINGGQTTHNLQATSISEDFYLIAKIVKLPECDENSKLQFAGKIAIASNSQKPIKDSDLKANSAEQQRLKKDLALEHIYYVTKKGDKIPANYDKDNKIDVTTAGKYIFAGILQMPGMARCTPSNMFKDKYYSQIFQNNVPATLVKDFMTIAKQCEKFKTMIRADDSGYDSDVVTMVKNGSLWLLACICFISKIKQNVIDYRNDIEPYKNDDNLDKLKNNIKPHRGMTHILRQNIADNIDSFAFVLDELAEILNLAKQKSDSLRTNDEKYPIANWLKADKYYYRFVLPLLWKEYHRDQRLKDALNCIIS